MEETKSKSNWYLLTGLIVGLLLGLVFSTLVFPAENAQALPNELNDVAKAEYRTMIATAYAANQDFDRALSRLELLKDPDPLAALTAQAQNMLANGGSEHAAKALAELASQLSQHLTPKIP
jgi:uncharacterized membrane-anchored protein YhcB (DUF1043 family)